MKYQLEFEHFSAEQLLDFAIEHNSNHFGWFEERKKDK